MRESDACTLYIIVRDLDSVQIIRGNCGFSNERVQNTILSFCLWQNELATEACFSGLYGFLSEANAAANLYKLKFAYSLKMLLW